MDHEHATAVDRSAATHARGFVLRELAAVVVILAIALALALVGAEHARRNARIGDEMAGFRFVYGGIMSYAADSADRHPMFDWPAGQAPIPPGDPAGAGLTFAADQYTAARNQMVYILRTHGQRPDMPSMAGLNLIPHFAYGQLVLFQYMNAAIPDRRMVSAGDRHRLLWADDPLGYDQGLYTPNFGTGAESKRHPYSGLWVNACFFDGSPIGYRVGPGPTTGVITIFNSPQVALGPQPLTAVAFPSQKALRHDSFGRFFGERTPYYSAPEARLPVLFCDGAASVKSSAEANKGANPNQPAAGVPLQTYTPSVIEPPATGANAAPMPAGFRWTRMGLLGRDFGGPDLYP